MSHSPRTGSPAAARVGDAVTHSAALWGLLEGALVGAALGAILVSTGGAAAPLLLAGAVASGASVGGAVGKLWGATQVVPCGTILTSSPNVRMNSRPAAFVGSVIACGQHPGPQMVAEGSATVRINGRPAARVGDHGTCGCVIAPPGSPNVFVGGAPASPVGYAGEVPWVADAALLALGLAGGGALMAVKGLGAAAIALKLGGQFFGGEIGAAGGHALGGKLFQEGSRGQTLLTFGGALVGGVGGGAVGGGLAGGVRGAAGTAGEGEAAAFGGRGPIRLGPVRGAASGRDFDPAAAGGPIRSLSTDQARITHGGVDVVERHVGRFPPNGDNAGMVQRLRDIADGKLDPTEFDRRFYTHELREYVRYRRLGWPNGLPDDPDARLTLWNDTHTATLEDYGLNERRSPLYHPQWDH